MLDFASLMDDGNLSLPLDPVEIFNQLPKSTNVSNLYASQANILRVWHESMRDKRDVVIELNTGGGKTLIGLLIALSTMNEMESGALYLVENRQLVSQVVFQGQELGIPVRPYEGKQSLDASFDNGECIVVASYQALFNGRSAFGIVGGSTFVRVGGIIIDDAHASLDAVRDVFSLSIPAGTSPATYTSILSEFRTAFESLELKTTYHDFFEGEAGITNDRVVEIPFWEWNESQSRIASILNKEYIRREHLDDEFTNNLKFSWPLLKDNLKYCQVTVSKRAITVSALYPLVNLFPTFTNANRRIFMSATITDYGDMVRAYDLRSLTTDTVIALKTPAGIGRRMILPLTSEIANTDAFSALVEGEIDKGHGVVRLVPRSGIEEKWYRSEIREPIGHDQVEPTIQELRNNTCREMVSFVNRYNGIDLPDDSCRILIIRGLPKGRNDSEELMASYLSESSINSYRIAQRIEQGAGRGVRSGSDHCVVLLEDDQLVDWIRRKRNKQHFSPALRAQLDMGERTNTSISSADEFCDAIRQDLSSEASWRAFHSKLLSQAITLSEDQYSRFSQSFSIASAERRAFACWREHQAGKGVAKIQEVAAFLDDDVQMRGWLLQFAARICFDGNPQNAAASEAIQRNAHSSNPSIPFYPFASIAPLCETTTNQAKALLDFLPNSGGNRRLLTEFDTNVSNLVAKAPEKAFVSSLAELGRYLGFDAEKHDRNGEGSDVVWISPDGIGFVLEAKNEKKDGTPFHKGEAGQLRTARDWFAELHPELEIVPVSVHPCKNADANASASNLYVLTLSKLDCLQEETRRLFEEALNCMSTHNTALLASYISGHNLSGRQIISTYLELFSTEKANL